MSIFAASAINCFKNSLHSVKLIQVDKISNYFKESEFKELYFMSFLHRCLVNKLDCFIDATF